jgi:hypothetical protein
MIMPQNGDKDVQFTVVSYKGWKTKSGTPKYYVDIDGEKLTLIAKPTDLEVGVTYVMGSFGISEFKKDDGSRIISYFANGTIKPVSGPPVVTNAAPPAESEEKKANRPAEVFEMLRAIVKVAKAVKEYATDPIVMGESGVKFDAEDLRTMMIQAFDQGATRAMIIKNREGEDDCPF